VTLEFAGEIVRLDNNGKIDKEHDVNLACSTCPSKIDTHPHGMGFGLDMKTILYTGKSTGTVGKITADGKVQTFGPDGNMWFTEMKADKVEKVWAVKHETLGIVTDASWRSFYIS
jgi:virginiamycin B lyase